jgi:hypothetical protein
MAIAEMDDPALFRFLGLAVIRSFCAERRIARHSRKAAAEIRRRHSDSATKRGRERQWLGALYAATHVVAMGWNAERLLERTRKVITTQLRKTCEFLQRDVFIEVLLDEAGHLLLLPATKGRHIGYIALKFGELMGENETECLGITGRTRIFDLPLSLSAVS